MQQYGITLAEITSKFENYWRAKTMKYKMKRFIAAGYQIQILYLKQDSKIIEYQLHKSELSKYCSSKQYHT